MRHLVLAVGAVVLSVGLAEAQQPSRGWLDVNFGAANAAEDEYSSVRQRPMFGETATGAVAYSFPTGGSFDIGGGYMFHPRVGVGVSFAGTAHEDSASLAISVPHPNFFNAHAADATVTDGTIERAEGTVHIQAMIVAVDTGKFRFRVFGGPSYFNVEQDTISEIRYDQVFQVFLRGNAVDITSYTANRSSASAWGFHGGFDASFFFTRVVGIGGQMRVSGGTVELPDYGGVSEVKAGGLQYGGGLRLRF